MIFLFSIYFWSECTCEYQAITGYVCNDNNNGDYGNGDKVKQMSTFSKYLLAMPTSKANNKIIFKLD